MQLIKWEPLSEVDRFFEDFPAISFPKLSWDMAVDMYEENGKVVAKMNLPGIDPDKVNVSVEDNTLRVSGAREEETEEKDKHYYSKEIRRGSFERSIRLPKSVDTEKVDAEYKNGTLNVTVPIVEKEGAKSIKVKTVK